MVRLKKKKKIRKLRKLFTAYDKSRRIGKRGLNVMGYRFKGSSKREKYFNKRRPWRAAYSKRIHLYMKRQYKRWFSINRLQRKQRRIKRANNVKYYYLLNCKNFLQRSFLTINMKIIEGFIATAIHPCMYERHVCDYTLYWYHILDQLNEVSQDFFILNPMSLNIGSKLMRLKNNKITHQIPTYFTSNKLLLYKPNNLNLNYSLIDGLVSKVGEINEQTLISEVFINVFWLSEDIQEYVKCRSLYSSLENLIFLDLNLRYQNLIKII